MTKLTAKFYFITAIWKSRDDWHTQESTGRVQEGEKSYGNLNFTAVHNLILLNSLQKKKEKKRNKEKRRSPSYSPSPPPQPSAHQQASSGSASPLLSESELESQRAALLAQLDCAED